MRKIFKLLLPFLVLAGCSNDKKSSDPGPVPVASEGQMAATVDGNSWASTAAAGGIVDGQITVVGQDSLGTLVLAVQATDVGSFVVKGAGSASTLPLAVVTYTPVDDTTYTSTYYDDGLEVGSIEITSIDETNMTISGTFSAKVKKIDHSREFEIKNGSFKNVPYIDQVVILGDNSASVKIAGVAMNVTSIIGLDALGSIGLSISDGSGQTITVNMPSDVTAGTYDLGSYGETYYGAYLTGTDIYESVSGTLTISLHDTETKHVVGTFSFSAEPFGVGGDAISVSEGAFDVIYN